MTRRTLSIVSFALGAMLVAAVAFADGPFTDVGPDDTHAENIDWAAMAEVMRGYPDGTFRPNLAVTRAQLATVLRNHDTHLRARPDYKLTPTCGELEMVIHNLGMLGSGAATVEYSVDGGDRIELDAPIPDDGGVLVFEPAEAGIVSLFVDGIAWAHAPTAEDCTPPVG